MTEQNYSYMEASARRKKRNRTITTLVIVALVVVGGAFWGWVEWQKIKTSERIKSALSPVPSYTEEQEFGTESVPMDEPEFAEPVQEPEPEPEPVARPKVEPKPPSPQPQPKPAPKPDPRPEVRVESKPKPAPKVEVARVEPTRPLPEAKVEPKREPSPPPPPEVQTPPAQQEPPKVAMVQPEPKPEPIIPPEKKVEEQVQVTNKVFEPEDLPAPAKPKLSEEAQQSVAEPEAPPAAVQGGKSSDFKVGMQAYQSGEMVQAVKNLRKVPKPSSKRKGLPERDEYVQANFYSGLALQKTGHLSEAVSAYQEVLDYEKYHPIVNMNLGICYVELKQYAKAHRAFQAVIRDQSFIPSDKHDDVMQRTKYFWALAWTRLYKSADNLDKKTYYKQQALQKWKDYQAWFSKNEKYKKDNVRAENHINSIQTL